MDKVHRLRKQPTRQFAAPEGGPTTLTEPPVPPPNVLNSENKIA